MLMVRSIGLECGSESSELVYTRITSQCFHFTSLRLHYQYPLKKHRIEDVFIPVSLYAWVHVFHNRNKDFKNKTECTYVHACTHNA